MCNCKYKVGDRVKNHGLCGTVTAKDPIGDCWMLTVKLASGDEVSWVCSEVTGC